MEERVALIHFFSVSRDCERHGRSQTKLVVAIQKTCLWRSAAWWPASEKARRARADGGHAGFVHSSTLPACPP